MKGTRKTPAVNKYRAMLEETGNQDTTLEALKADDKAYSEEEIEEIWEAVTFKYPDVPKFNEFMGVPAKKAEKPKPYVLYDKWMVHVEAQEVDDDAPDAEYKVRFIKPIRANRPITDKVAAELNSQTQNNSVMYVPSGSVETGQETIIKVSRGRKKGRK